MWVTGNLHQGRFGLKVWHGERTHISGGGIETPQVVIAGLREPYLALGIDRYPVGIKRLHASPGREWVLLNLPCTYIKLTQRVGVQLREPYIAVAIERQVVRRAW